MALEGLSVVSVMPAGLREEVTLIEEEKKKLFFFVQLPSTQSHSIIITKSFDF